jgi:phosphatidate cytidylyltransferase
MKQRVITAVISLLALMGVLFLLPPAAAQAVIALVMLAGAWEWSAFLTGPARSVRPAYVALVAALIAIVTFVPGVDTLLILKVSLAWWLAALLWTFAFPTPVPAALRWFGGIAVLVPLYLALMVLYEVSPGILLLSLVIVWVADSGAYLAGKTMGRVKLAPKISPGKTWEGVIGGFVAVVLLALVRAIWVETDLAVFIPFCLAVACISIVGDLTVSMFKRTVGVKDSGTLFPGHGGVLDRIDSVAAAAPLFALGLTWVGLR